MTHLIALSAGRLSPLEHPRVAVAPAAHHLPQPDTSQGKSEAETPLRKFRPPRSPKKKKTRLAPPTPRVLVAVAPAAHHRAGERRRRRGAEDADVRLISENLGAVSGRLAPPRRPRRVLPAGSLAAARAQKLRSRASARAKTRYSTSLCDPDAFQE